MRSRKIITAMFPRSMFTAAFCGACAFLAQACAPLQSLPTINVADLFVPRNSARAWTGPTLIDAGDYEANNDTSRGCLDTGAGDTGLLDGASIARGCMQPSPIVQSDGGAWFVGFYQSYLFAAAAKKFTAFVNSTFFGSAFGALGAGLSIIDTGMGLAPIPVIPTAGARRIRFAKLSNGDIAAVFLVHNPSTGLANADDRVAFASVYDSTTHAWGSPTQLGTAGVESDVAVDLNANTWNTPFCAPAVAAGPNGTALATWCERRGAESRAFYATYSGGAWSASAQLITQASNVAFPGFSGMLHTFTAAAVNTTTIQAGETFTIAFDGTTEGGIACASDCAASVVMTASASAPATPNEFQILTKADGTVLLCSTLQQALAAALGATPAAPATRTLAQRGVSTWINPACSDSDSATWTFAVRFNQAQAARYRTIGAATDNAVAAVTETFANLNFDAGTAQTNPVPYSRNAFVDVAGDSSGNFVAVRSVVAPVFDDNAATVGAGRQLVGHVYLNGSGWQNRSGGTDPEAFLVSRNPACYSGNTATTGATYFACSVRHPKVLMSDSGAGLVLYYQNQRDPVSPTVATSSNSFPNRLWFSTYSLASGFSSAAAPVDSDVLCNSSSLRNDANVCEGGSATLPCQLEREPAALPLSSAAVDSDLPPIAAAMNPSGAAIVAYHKSFYLSSGSCSSTVGVNAVFHDPSNGMGGVTQLDDGAGNTMNASAAINGGGDAVVVWEEIVSGARYVYLRSYSASSGGWSAQEIMNTGLTASSDAAMPSASISDSGEILVSFTANAGTGTTRRQYIRRYRP